MREKAQQLREGILRSRGDALLPLSLATFIFEALVTALPVPQCRGQFYSTHRLPTDEMLGFEASVAALGLKANVSEADQPLLCEGTRRQRGDLAVMLLVHYKDDPDKLAKIMEKLLDRQIHPLYKAPLLSSFYTNNPTPMGSSSSSCAHGTRQQHSSNSQGQQGVRHRGNLEGGMAALGLDRPASNGTASAAHHASSAASNSSSSNMREQSPTWEDDYATWQAGSHHESPHGSGGGGGAGGSGGSRANVASAVRNRLMHHRPNRHAGPGSDSGSSGSGKSSGSDSMYSRAPPNIVQTGANQHHHHHHQHQQQQQQQQQHSTGETDRIASIGRGNLMGPSIPTNISRAPNTLTEMGGSLNGGCVSRGGNGTVSTGACSKVNRFKGKRLYPSVPNQPSEASAHFMFELAKTVLTKAGGNSSTSLFTQPINSQNPRGPHRALHMCAFQIGLYALGLHNCVSAKWLSRTYSSHVSWITGTTFGNLFLWKLR